MSGAPTPQFLPRAFAIGAGGPYINTIPDTTVTPARASFTLGFPPLTMTPVVSGGKPPFGQDVNGILYMLSTWSIYQQAGETPRFSSTVAAAISGYSLGTLLRSTDGSTLWFNILDGNTNDPDANGAGWVPVEAYGLGTVSTTGGSTTLPLLTAAKSFIVVTGALAANATIVLPNHVRSWLIVNATSGAQTVTVKTAAGSGVAIPQGGFAEPVGVYGDGTNIYPVVAPLSIPTAEGPVPSTYPIRSAAGYLYAVFFNMSGAADNLAITDVFYMNGTDGFLRHMSQANFRAQLFVDPTFTGVPAAPTAAPGTNTTQLATTAFVQAAVGGSGRAGWFNMTGAGHLLPPGWLGIKTGVGKYTVVHNLGLPDNRYLAVTTQPYLSSGPAVNRYIRFNAALSDGNQFSIEMTDVAESTFVDSSWFFDVKVVG